MVQRMQGLHTLCLLDIKVKEPNLEQLCRGRKVYEPPQYMTISKVWLQDICQHGKRQPLSIIRRWKEVKSNLVAGNWTAA